MAKFSRGVAEFKVLLYAVYMTGIKRIIPIVEVLKRKSVLLLGPRRTGKSYLTEQLKEVTRSYDLLDPEVFRRLTSRPELLREELTDHDKIIVIDEIQKLPVLMDLVHSLIEKKKARFILTGSSARKLKREHTSLMGGRAKKMLMHPFVSAEIPNAKLSDRLQFGSLPIVYEAIDPWDELRDYAGLYLKEEIMAEALVRKIDHFSRFLDFAAKTSGQLLNYESLASDAQIPARTVREYYAILQDTLMGETIDPIRSTANRKSISTGKFYFFDTGVLNSLLGRKSVSEKTKEYGDLFEHLIANELIAYRDYFLPDLKINFWRINEEGEVDFVLNEEIAIEVKSTTMVQEKQLKGILKFASLGKCSKMIVVSMDKTPRLLNGVQILPYQDFLRMLWGHEIVV